MKKNILLLFILFCAYLGYSQTYYNEWINYSQSYYKIPISKDGLYRIDSLKLAQAGIPIGTIDPNNLQLFQKGKELHIHISGEADGVFNGTDYILFYAEKNTCKDDSTLYYYGTFLTNPYYSVINDTSAVFLTWNFSTANKRMSIETDTSFSSYTPTPYFIKEDILAYNSQYFNGPQNSIGATDPRYAHGEGLFQGPTFGLGNNKSYSFNTSTLYAPGPFAHATIVHSGMSNPFYSPDHDVMIEYQNLSSSWIELTYYSYDGHRSFRNDFSIDPATIGSSFSLRLNNVANPIYNANATAMGVHYAKLVFPSTFNLLGASSQKLYLSDEISQSKAFLSINNFNTLSSNPLLVDLTNNKLISVVENAGTLKALVPNGAGSKTCYLSSWANVNAVSSITPVNGNGQFVNYSALAADSVYLIVSNKKLEYAANQYANYRSSAAGGSHNVLVAYVQDLYDQFAYGVNRHPFSVKHFSKFLINTYPSHPKNLLLLGKSIHPNEVITNVSNASRTLVPTFGYPASDNLLTQGLLNPASLAPAIATGRISAENDSMVIDYLNKVMLHEAEPKGQLWQKNALHFIGGNNAYEQTVFNSYMDVNKAIFEDTLIGGKVYTFRKTSTDPIAINTNDSIRQVIEAGLSLITFFGHGSVSGFEQNIDDPYTYNNSPRFPLLISNSCYTGDIHTSNVFSTSERFVLADDHGTIGFLASISTGVSYALQLYTEQFYKSLSFKNYGKSYGACIQDAVQNVELIPTSINDSIVKVTCLEMTLHGDPAISQRVSPLPDFEIVNSDVSIDTESQVDSINININFRNLGKTINDSISVFVERTLPSGALETYLRAVIAPSYATTVNFNIDKNVLNAVGLNKFSVRIDYFNEVSETNESNNATSGQISTFVTGGDIMPVYPYNYAVIPTISSTVVKASTADPMASTTTYRLQVDTSDAFSNPILNTTVTSIGGVISAPVTLLNTDSMVYFWRVGKDSSNVNLIKWRESSFQTIANKSGWSQAHFHQFKNDQFQFVSYNKPQRKFEFKNSVNSLLTRTGFVGSPTPPYLNFAENSYYLNNSRQNYWSCGDAVSWSFAVFDSVSGIPLTSDTLLSMPNGTWLSQYNSCVCVAEPHRPVFDFGLNNYCGDNVGNMNSYMQRMEDFLNAVPNGYHVLAYSRCNDSSHLFTPSLIQAFKKIGSVGIDLKTDTTQLIIFGVKKSVPHATAHETLGNNLLDIIAQSDTFSTKWNNGHIASEIIGPALQWRSFHWRYTSMESPTTDSILIKIVGIKANGLRDTLAVFRTDSLDVLNLQNYVDVNTYPYLQLVAFESDYVNHTAPQLKRWQVLYDEVPEAAIDPTSGFSINTSKVTEGNELVIRLPIKNIGNTPFTDSLLVTYWVEDANGVEHPLPYKLKYKPFMPNDIIIDTIKFNTLGYKGLNALWVDMNVVNHPKYQLEQFHFNNIVRIPFDVVGDKINPLLDVTFDGIHILNGDIISPTPGIMITLKDENKFLALNDTADFTVYLKYPGTVQEQHIYFNQGLIFTPAQLPNNSCKIEYTPPKLADGKYELRVQARDRSANESGANDYKIQFEVINKSTITEVLNYPNPFSTSTKFVFTLTGSEVPETFKIQVMTISGKVVREITKEEIGNIHIGRNITEFAWNGKDEFGDQLANGVYLYRVVTRLNGEMMEKRETAADEYFKKGWGKLVIMR